MTQNNVLRTFNSLYIIELNDNNIKNNTVTGPRERHEPARAHAGPFLEHLYKSMKLSRFYGL